MGTSGFLADYGTKAIALKPSSIVHAAQNDLRTRGRGTKAAAARWYLFCWAHVKDAKGPADLIARALMDYGTGQASRDVHTRTVYRDLDLLRAALALAEAEAPAAATHA